jgi:hypothetical protein
MGAHPYWYFVAYEADAQAALEALRKREFKAGRYNPAVRYIEFPVDVSKPSPGAKHRSIEAALEASEAEGTRSILDIERVGTEADSQVAALLDGSVLEELYGTVKPTHDMIEKNMDFMEDIERGQAIYFVVYKDGRADELFFAGYSFD